MLRTHLIEYLQAVRVIVVSEVNHSLLVVSSWMSPSVLPEPPQTLIPLLDSARLQPAGVTLRWRVAVLSESLKLLFSSY